MEYVILVLLITLIALLFYAMQYTIEVRELDRIFFMITSIIVSCIIFILYLICCRRPQAIDVYRDKTTLEITYKDGVPIDSTVVWKDK